jgi:hypothetical protein
MATVAGTVAIGLATGSVGCSSTAVFDAALAKDVEAQLNTEGDVRCDHQVRDLWLCSYEPDPGSNSYAEVMVRRGAGDCWIGRQSRITPGPSKAYSPRSLSLGHHHAAGRALRGCT